jgi:hypothetical protein
MQCSQLIRLMKDWYLHVKEETMAPARMMQFADKHIESCAVCQQDDGLAVEIEKIRDFVLPESKIPKAERDDEDATPEISPDDEEERESVAEEDEDEFADDFDEDDEV